MLEYLKGEIAELTPTSVTIDCNGVGYLANISLNTYTALNGSASTKIYVYESIREDAHVLFGFSEKRERDLFTHLISVSGVGPSTARVILSSLTAAELESVITSENVSVLQSVKGIGAKTAQRIIVDLRDKIKLSAEGAEVKMAGSNISITGQEAVSALVMLGFTAANSQKAVSKVVKDNHTLSVEGIIKEALKIL